MSISISIYIYKMLSPYYDLDDYHHICHDTAQLVFVWMHMFAHAQVCECVSGPVVNLGCHSSVAFSGSLLLVWLLLI